MTTFILACAGLVLLSGLFYLFPRRGVRRGEVQDQARANLDWYRLRQEELGTEDAALEQDAQLRLLEDAARDDAPDAAAPASQRFPAWVLLPIVAVAASGLYYQLGAAPDVVLSERIASLDETASPSEVYAVLAAIEERSQQRPDNLHYRALLGRFYMGQEDYTSAAETYSALVEAAPEDAQALAYAAQARYLAAGRVLDPESQRMAEQALSINPHQRTALGLLGMASFEQQQYRAAIQYWERLQATEQPGTDSDQMIASVIQQARNRLGETGSAEEGAISNDAAMAQAGADGGAGVTVRVDLPGGADLNPGDTVFVLARNPDSGGRMPIAVQRLSASQLPMTLRLDDRHSMAGQKISASPEVEVVVQVSPSGRPGEANATWLGRAGPLAPATDSEPVTITLVPRSG